MEGNLGTQSTAQELLWDVGQSSIGARDKEQCSGYCLFDGVDVSVSVILHHEAIGFKCSVIQRCAAAAHAQSMMGMNLTAAGQQSSKEFFVPEVCQRAVHCTHFCQVLNYALRCAGANHMYGTAVHAVLMWRSNHLHRP